MITYEDEAIERLIDKAAEQVERRIERSAERAVGFYYEKTKHDIDLVLEATGFIKDRLEDMVTRDEFNELGGEVKLIRQAITDTNNDLSQFNKPGWFPGKRR